MKYQLLEDNVHDTITRDLEYTPTRDYQFRIVANNSKIYYEASKTGGKSAHIEVDLREVSVL